MTKLSRPRPLPARSPPGPFWEGRSLGQAGPRGLDTAFGQAVGIRRRGGDSSCSLPPRFLSLEQQAGDDGRPSRLVARPQPGPALAVEVLVKRDAVPPLRVGLEVLVVPPRRAPAPP